MGGEVVKLSTGLGRGDCKFKKTRGWKWRTRNTNRFQMDGIKIISHYLGESSNSIAITILIGWIIEGNKRSLPPSDFSSRNLSTHSFCSPLLT